MSLFAIISMSKYNSLSGISGTKSANSLNNVYGVQYAVSFAHFANSFSYISVTSTFIILFSEFFDLTTWSRNSI